MSLIHQADIGSQRKPVFDIHRVRNKVVSVPGLSPLLVPEGVLSQEDGGLDSKGTSSAGTAQSSAVPSQGSSLSSQEMMAALKDSVHVSNGHGTGMATENDIYEQRSRIHTNDNGVLQDPVVSALRQQYILPNSQRLAEPVYKSDTAAGQKRMANGEIKTANTASPDQRLDMMQMPSASPQQSPKRSPQIGQLTDKLRTRLAYAMVKVQNGWESRRFTELENLATQPFSPRTETYENQQAMSPPRRKIATSPERPSTRGTISSNMLSTGGKRSPGASSSSSAASDLASIRQSVLPGKSHKPTLAPPVDLGPRNPRRSNPPAFALPGMTSKLNSNLSDSSTSSMRLQVTTTPSIAFNGSAPTSTSRPPSSAMEQDAIETLLFMSSPSNTQYRPSSQSQQQQQLMPFAFEPSTTSKRGKLLNPIAMAAHVAGTDTIPVSPRKKLMIEDLDLGDDQNIDQALDQMPVDQGEEDSSSEEDAAS